MSGANHLASSSGRELPRFARRWAVLFGLVAVASLASGCRRSEEPESRARATADETPGSVIATDHLLQWDPAQPAVRIDSGVGEPLESLPGEVSRLLDASHVVFEPPADGVLLAPKRNPHWGYLFAVRAADGAWECRYDVRPLAPFIEQKRRCDARPDSGCIVGDPNRFAEGAFAAVIRNIGQSKIGAPMAMCEALRGQFRADSGATIGYLPHETFSKDYSAGLAAYAQRDGVAFMIVAAMATSAEHEPQMRACIKALRFE